MFQTWVFQNTSGLARDVFRDLLKLGDKVLAILQISLDGYHDGGRSTQCIPDICGLETRYHLLHYVTQGAEVIAKLLQKVADVLNISNESGDSARYFSNGNNQRDNRDSIHYVDKSIKLSGAEGCRGRRVGLDGI